MGEDDIISFCIGGKKYSKLFNGEEINGEGGFLGLFKHSLILVLKGHEVVCLISLVLQSIQLLLK